MMNLYDEKDDSLNRLFRNSQSNLDEMPSHSVWDKIEARLDAHTHAKSPPDSRFFSLARRYSAAASLVLGLLSVGLVWRMFANENPATETQSTLAEAQPQNQELAENLPVNAKEAEAIYKQEDSAQAVNLKSASSSVSNDNKPNPSPLPLPAELPLLVETNNAKPQMVLETPNAVAKNNSLLSNTIAILSENGTADNKKIAEAPIPKDVDMNDNAGLSPDDNVAAEYDSPNVTAGNVADAKKNTAEKIVKNDIAPRNNSARYASPNNPSADEVQTINSIAMNENAKVSKDKTSQSPKAKTREKSKNKEEHYAQKLNPRMKMLAWLIGRWQDDSRYDGVSYEEWTIKDANTLQGRGYKLKGKDRLFEEAMTIKLDENLQQIFLQISVDDYKQPVLYMLSGINPEELTFSLDMPSNNYPEKIILQRSLSGYTIITHNGSRDLSPSQQSFLNNRNIVNTQRAIRNMSPNATGK